MLAYASCTAREICQVTICIDGKQSIIFVTLNSFAASIYVLANFGHRMDVYKGLQSILIILEIDSFRPY